MWFLLSHFKKSINIMRKIFYWFFLVAVLILFGAGWYYYSAVWEAQKGIEIKVEDNNTSKPETDSDLAKEDDLTSVTGQGEVVSIDEKKIVIKDIDGRQQSWEIAERPMVQTLNMNNLIYEDSLLADVEVGSNVFLAGLGNNKSRYAHLIQSEFFKKYEGILKLINEDKLMITLGNGKEVEIGYTQDTVIKEMLAKQELVDNNQLIEGDFLIVYCSEIKNNCKARNIIYRKASNETYKETIAPLN